MSNPTTFTRCNARCVVFATTGQRSKGVTKVIRHIFFPSYNVQKLRGPTVPNKGGLRLRQAKARGHLVDRQLGKLAGDTTLCTPPPRACVETTTIMDCIRRRGYYIESAQHTVGYAPWRLATDIDLVLRPVAPQSLNHDHRVVVEVKRGCLYRRRIVPHTTSQHLATPVSVCPLHVHQLQAVLGKRLLQLNDSTLPVTTAWLLYVDPIHGIELIEENEFDVQWSSQSEQILEQTAEQLTNGRPPKRKHITTNHPTTRTPTFSSS